MTAVFKNALLGTREVYLPFPGKKRPKKVDLQLAIGSEITHPHDWYHVNLASQVAADHQWGFVLLSQLLQEMASEKEFAQVQPFLMRISEILIDMEHHFYRKELSFPPFEGEEPSILFWKSLSDSFQNAVNYRAKESGELDILVVVQQISNYPRIFERLFKEVVKHQSAFATLGIRFGLAILERLEALTKKEMDQFHPLLQLAFQLSEYRQTQLAFVWPDLMRHMAS